MLGQDVGPGSVGCDTVVSPTPFLLETNNIYASQAPYNEGKTVQYDWYQNPGFYLRPICKERYKGFKNHTLDTSLPAPRRQK